MKDYSEAAEKYRGVIENYRTQYPYLNFTQLAEKIIAGENLNFSTDYFRKVVGSLKSKREINVNLDDDVFEIEVPDSLYTERPRFIIPSLIDRMLYIADLHIPYHSIEAIKMAIKYGYENGMRAIFIGGDAVDFYAVSRYDRLPHLRNLKVEIEAIRQFLTNLRNKFPDIEIYYKIGNHEQRYIKYLSDKAPELFDVDSLQIEDLLHLNKLRIRLIDYNTISEFGRLNIIHGHEILGGGVHTAHNLRIKAGDHILFGHFHRTQESLARNIKDNVIGAWSVGCLCGLSPEYMPINNWNHGFAFITRQSDGNFVVKNKTIINGFIY